ncbi:MAG: hypothetical protein WC441_03925 [Patescibacteria group bacterium]
MTRHRQEGQKLRHKRKTRNVIRLLNANIGDLNLSVIARASLEKMDIKNLAQFRNDLLESKVDLKNMGLKAREELHQIFKTNHIKMPANWIWGL